MKTTKLLAVTLALALAACAQAPKPAATAAAPTTGATAPPMPLAAAAPPPATDSVMVATARRDLQVLGYAGGKSGEMTDAAFQQAILAFEKDQGMAEDGRLSPAVAEQLKLLRAALLKTAPAEGNRDALFFYSDGDARRQALGLLIAPPAGLSSDAPANFLQPLRPGIQAAYHLGKRAQDGNFTPVTTVTCHAGRVAQTNLPLGLLYVIAVDCRSDAPKPLLWRSLYSPALGLVLRQQTAAGVRDLVAIRPVTSGWPSAARTGLDWAITHALESTGPDVPVEWSSTAVAPRFEIKAVARISGAEAGLSGRYAAQPCRRFEMVQSGAPASHFPAIACQNAGVWSLPGTSIHLAAPATGIAAASATVRSAQN